MFEQHPVASVKQLGQERIALAEERRKEEYHHAQRNGTDHSAMCLAAPTAEPLLHTVCDAKEVERHSGTENTKHNIIRYLRQSHLADDIERELQLVAHQEVSHRRRTDSRKHQRQNRRGRHIEHKHLNHKQNAGYRSLEYASDGTCSATTQQKLDIVGTKPEKTAYIRAYCAARRGYGRLKSNAAAERYGKRRRHQR